MSQLSDFPDDRQQRVEEIVLTIVRLIVRCNSDAEIEELILGELVDEGYTPVEIMEAFALLGRIGEFINVRTLESVAASALSRHRDISSEESLRMTEEAIQLFNSWQSLDLTSPDEAENILQHVIMAGPGDIDTGELIRIAESVTARDSTLALYLTSPASLQ